MHRDVEATREIVAAPGRASAIRLLLPCAGRCHAITSERKREIAAQFGANEQDTGNTKVQIALLTERINHLTEHLRDAKRTTTPAVAC